ncbi:SapC family protein [Pseudoalteromonas sp.]|uniref:SapC family protein n=1 Tax=Pseudoalteromonas sp. TaxID=53249 RepID=UPI00356AAA5A
MAKFELVNNIAHKNIKVNTKASAQFGDNVWFALTFPDEFRAIQNQYPIFFQKNSETGQFMPVALMGVKQNENLFLTDDGWDGYIPATIKRHPFAIGHQQQNQGGQTELTRVLTIDMESPRVNETQGEALFLEYGGNSDYLDQMADLMEAIHNGVEKSAHFIETLLGYELIEQFTLDVTLNDGSQNQMLGFYTINEDKLAELSDEQTLNLVKLGYLQAIYFIIASHGNIAELVKRKNKQLGL